MKKVLVIQSRTREDKSLKHEQNCILERAKGINATFEYISCLEENEILKNPKLLKNFDKVIFGGSGEVNLSKPQPENILKLAEKTIKNTKKIFEYIKENDFPTFGTCYGLQLMGLHLGGKVVNDPIMAETGIKKIFLTKEGEKDILFKDLNNEFFAISGHKDSLIDIEETKDFKILAYSEKTPIHAFRYKKNIYASQFHGELSKKDLLWRLDAFPSYGKIFNPEELKLDTSEAVLPLRKFLLN